MSKGSTARALAAWALAALAIGVFLVSALRHLDVVPRVYEDEPWQASTAYKLLTHGTFGSDLFAGFYRMDERYYGFLPLHPFVLAGFFRVLGVGLLQARLETVSLSVLVLVLTCALGARLFHPGIGALAVALLVVVRWTGLTYLQLTGIPLTDFARIARYDPLVPVLGLGALHVYLSSRSSKRAWTYLGPGVLAGLAGLAHLYGLFWLPVLVVLTLWADQPRSQPRRWMPVGWLAVGALLPWLPYAAYVLSDLADWRGQTLIYANRFELLNGGWYVDNLVQEYHRYGPGLGPFGLGWMMRVGFFFSAVGLPLALLALIRKALVERDASARVLVVPAILLPALFALLIKLKLVNYTLTELPIFALAIAWGVFAAWRRRWLRLPLAALAVALTIEGAVQLVRLEHAAASTTPYPTFIGQVRAQLPDGARVLGLHTYWFGLEDFDYRSFLVPLNLADEGVPLDEALARVAPDVVLLDAKMRDYFNSPEIDVDRDRFLRWLGAHDGRLIASINDPTYGLMEVYAVRRS